MSLWTWMATLNSRGVLCDKVAMSMGLHLPRTTERPVRERGDECSELPAREVPQSHGRKPVVRGLPRIMSEDVIIGMPYKKTVVDFLYRV